MDLVINTGELKSLFPFFLGTDADPPAYCVVAIESAGRQVPIALLEQIKDDFTKIYGDGKAADAVANTLDNKFGYVPSFIPPSLAAKKKKASFSLRAGM